MSAREVTLVGGSPWGFRMHGGLDLNQPLRISRVNPGSKAAQQGVREGDLISSINGKNTRDLTNADAHALLRNAGDQLKLGLNQETSGSPKGKVYKSSLQTDTSIETVHKTTTKTILNTRIVSSSEINKKNGIDDTSRYSSLNGGPKSSENRTDGEKKQDTENYSYATDAEESNTKMPCSSRNRRNRRNRNRKRIQRPTSPPKDISTSEAEEVDEQNFISNKHSITKPEETAGTSEIPNHLPVTQNLSITKSRVKRNKCKIKQKRVDSNSQVCEIIDISTEPLTAKVDHIDGVGIVESGVSQDENSVITIMEPLELFGQASDELPSAIKKKGSDKDIVVKHNGVEISEVDSDVDVENSKTPIISENDSDRKEDSGDDLENHKMSPDEEKNLRNFIETLQLPSLSTQSDHVASHKIDAEKIAAASIPYKKAYKRAILESYYSQSHEARCLDIIQEEGEKISEEADQNIRDFINEEIGKFRRNDDYPRRQLSEESDHGENEWHNKIINVINENHLEENTGSSFVENECINSYIKIPKNIVETAKNDTLSKNLINSVTEKVTQMTNEIQKDLQMYSENLMVDNLQQKQKSNSTESEVPIFENDVDVKEPRSQNNCCNLNGTPEILSLPSNITISPTDQSSIPLIREQVICSTSDQNISLSEMQSRLEPHSNVSRYKTLEALLKKISENSIPIYAYPYFDVLCAITEYDFPNDSFLIFDTISQAILSHNCSRESLRKLPSFDKLNVPKIINDLVQKMQIKSQNFNSNDSLNDTYKCNDDAEKQNHKINHNIINEEGKMQNLNKDEQKLNDVEKKIEQSVNETKHINSNKGQNDIEHDFSQTDNKSFDCPKVMKLNDSNDDEGAKLYSSSNALSSLHCLGNDLSNSFTTVSTEKFYPLQASVTDITSVIEEEKQNNKRFGKKPRCQERSPVLNRKLTLLQGLEKIKYSSIKYLNHVPSNNISNEHPPIMKENYYQPESLTNISLNKLLSIPYGSKVIQKLIKSDCNIYGSNCDHAQSSLNRNTAKCVNSLNNQTMGHRPNIWVGVPTEENPKLLVCLSPSQQESQVNTSVDKLLDLHRKFLNRTRCQSETKTPCVSPLLYHFNYDPPETQNNNHLVNKRVNLKKNFDSQTCDCKQDCSKITQFSDWLKVACQTSASNSAYDINCNTENNLESTAISVPPVLYQFILDQTHEDVNNVMSYNVKKNVESECHSTLRNSDPNEDGLNLTRSCDWLNLARRNFTSVLLTDDCNHSKDKIIITKPNAAIRNRIPERHYVNSALIVRGNDSAIRNTTPLRRSPISMNSAIIDKSPTTSDRKWTPMVCKRSWDFRHNVNSALIDDKPSMPAKAKRIVTVDRSCIDSRSLFDNCQRPIKVADTSQLKKITAAQIMDNLKQLQASLVKEVNVQSEHSVPQRYFEDQLEYVERLEKQLKKVISAAEGNEVKDQVPDEPKLDESQTSSENKLNQEEILLHHIDSEDEINTVIRRKNNHKTQSKVFRNTTHFENLGQHSPEAESWKNELLERPKSTILSAATNGEVFRQMMFDEYVNKVLEREKRKHLNIVKISSHADLSKQEDKPNMSTVELEFMEKAKNRLHKFGIQLDELESETNGDVKETEDKDSGAEAKCLVDGKEVTDAKNLPKHLREFLKIPRITEDESDVENVMYVPTFKASSAKPGVWSPGSERTKQQSPEHREDIDKDDGIAPIWTPSSAGPSPRAERKEFRPVQFESPVLGRKKKPESVPSAEAPPPPWEQEENRKEPIQSTTSRIVNSHSAPTQGLNTLAGAPRLPRAQNPTITLLQKAREGQIPKGAAYLDQTEGYARSMLDDPLISPGEVVYTPKKEYQRETEQENEWTQGMADSSQRQCEGIGPTTRDGMPLVLRSEVKEDNQAKWYKKMYDSLHRAGKKDDYVTIRYKPRRANRYNNYGNSARSGYLSEPESRVYDKSATLDSRRRLRNKENDYPISTIPRNRSGSLKHSPEPYRITPGRIEDYEPGQSTISDKEAKEWWDEVMDIFDGWLDENGRGSSEGQRFDKMPRALSLSYRPESNRHNVRVPNLNLCLKSCNSETRMRDKKLENGGRRRLAEVVDSQSVLGRSKNALLSDKARFVDSLKLDLRTNDDMQSGRIIRPLGHGDFWQAAGMLEGKSKSFVLPDRNMNRSTPQIGPRSSRSTRLEDLSSFLPTMPSSRNHRHHRIPPSSSTSSSSSSSTTHITLPTPTSNAKTSPSRQYEHTRNSNTPKSYMSQALKESGYESDSTLIFRRREDVNPLSPLEQRLAYKTIQRGGDVPLHGLRKAAPERPKDDSEIEYFPISPTLTRIRVHRKSSTAPTSGSSMIRSKKSTPPVATACKSQVTKSKSVTLSQIKAPFPPKRKSSRNNETLKLYARSNANILKQLPTRRHQQCFIEEGPAKLNSGSERQRKEEGQKVKVRASSLGRLTSDLVKRKSETCLSRNAIPERIKVQATRVVHSVSKTLRDSQIKACSCKEKIVERKTFAKSGARSVTDTSASVVTKNTEVTVCKRDNLRSRKVKREPCTRIGKFAADLSSPSQVQKVLQNQRERDIKETRTRASPQTIADKSGKASHCSGVTAAKSKVDRKPLNVASSITNKAQEILLKASDKIKGRIKSTIAQEPNNNGISNKRKRPRERPQTIVRSSINRPRTIHVVPDCRTERGESKKKFLKGKSSKPVVEPASKKLADRSKKSVAVTTTELTMDRLKEHQEAMKSDAFFQHLFLQNLAPIPLRVFRNSSVLGRVRMFQQLAIQKFKSEPSLRALAFYLAHKRPVSNSRFRIWEQESVSSRSTSPCGRSIFPTIAKFDSMDDIGSLSSLRGRGHDFNPNTTKERSSSEPPLKSLPEKGRVGSRASSPTPSLKRCRLLTKQDSPSKIRARSAGDAEDLRRKVDFGSSLSISKSTCSLSSVDKDEYRQYILELIHSKKKSDKYKDLRDFYASLERMGELEKRTSCSDLRPRLRNEQIIDYDRWKKVRTAEKAEKELKALYGKLKVVQKDKNFVFSTTDVERLRWRGDVGLKCKERSVENIKEQFRRLQERESELETTRRREIEAKKDAYKPFWRGSSVADVANTIAKKAIERSEVDRSTVPSLQRSLGGSKKFWSSLSIEQVNSLKNQLNEIYGNDQPRRKLLPQSSTTCETEYEIFVPPEGPIDGTTEPGKGLNVRCHSMITTEEYKSNDVPSDGFSSQTKGLERSLSDRVVPSAMTEIEKKRLSLTLGREVLDKIFKKRSLSSITPRETRGAIAAASASTDRDEPSRNKNELDKDTNKQVEYILSVTPDDTLQNKGDVENAMEEWSKGPPVLVVEATEDIEPLINNDFDSATDSDNSVRTIIANDEVPKKIEFFENIAEPKLDHLRPSQSFTDLKGLFGDSGASKYSTLPIYGSRSRSTSPQMGTSGRRGKGWSSSGSADTLNARQLFHQCSREREFERPRSASPFRAVTASSSSCSHESVYQRGSPDPERYWQTYLKLIRDGTVRRLRAKYESLEDLPNDRARFANYAKRFPSDPEIARSVLRKVSEDYQTNVIKAKEIPDVARLRRKYEPGRTRRRGISPPIPRVPWRKENYLMPHINVISKMAELKNSTASRSPSPAALEARELEARRPVGRVRDKFEKCSILGQMFTSAPDVHELRDVAPYLTGQWVAHQFPSRRDNARSLSSPPELGNRHMENGISPKRKSEKSRSVSPSPTRKPVSILKQSQEDTFDPSKHRPKFRYQPPPPTVKSEREFASWWPALPTYTARPTVTFEEYSNPPPPPPKSQHYRGDSQESPRRYVEGDITIHYRSPVRTEAKELLSEEELTRRSAENMRRVYQEERRRKYLQELHDIDSRRHTDNFIPSQKSPISLNRYDDFIDDLSSYRSRSQDPTPEPRLVARALYNFVGQSPRELTFRRGDLIFVRRQVDKNWYEGEHNAMVGLFPFNYVEIIPFDGMRTTPKKPYEGQARAKFNFIAQTHLELSLAKGELVVLTRRVDENWYEGRIGNRKGIFPTSYVEVLAEPGNRPETPVQSKPVASPAAHSLLSNGSSGGKLSMGPHHYTPIIPNSNMSQPHYNSLPRCAGNKMQVAPAMNETLHIDTHSEPIPYRALYNYRPQNEDELELKENDTVYVMEKCDDGWYVGSSQRTGYFGTFPGNYVERL